MLYLRTDGPRHWRLVYPYVYKGNRDTFVVPAGYRTDLASTPRALWAIFPPFGAYSEAAVIHDWLLSERVVHSRDAHGIFRRIMGEHGVPRWQRDVMYSAVRLYWTWRGDR